MNKDNMQKLIDAIKFDGQKKFNMSVFLGKLNLESQEELVFEDGELASQYGATRVTSVITGTDMFNCTSMGCIAGFATALANDWKAPAWLSKDDHGSHVSSFEQTSNMFLGLTHEEGRNIYFADSCCIWKWLMLVEPQRYSKLKLEQFDTLEIAEEEGMYWDDVDLCVDFSSIDYLTAVDVLTRIMNEEIGLCDESGEPYYIQKEAVLS